MSTPQKGQNLIFFDIVKSLPGGQIMAYPIWPLHCGQRIPNSKKKTPDIKPRNPKTPMLIKTGYAWLRKSPMMNNKNADHVKTSVLRLTALICDRIFLLNSNQQLTLQFYSKIFLFYKDYLIPSEKSLDRD